MDSIKSSHHEEDCNHSYPLAISSDYYYYRKQSYSVHSYDELEQFLRADIKQQYISNKEKYEKIFELIFDEKDYSKTFDVVRNSISELGVNFDTSMYEIIDIDSVDDYQFADIKLKYPQK